MADLKLLTDRLMENKRSEIQETIQAAEQKAQAMVHSANESLKAEKEKRKERIQTNEKAQYEKNKNALSNQKRNQLLAEKQRALTAVFDAAKERLSVLEPAEFQQFLMGVLAQYQNKEVELVVGEKSRSAVTELTAEDWKQSGTIVHLSNDVIPKEAGFVIRHEGIDYNYLFDAMVEDMKDDILPEISQKLFQ